MRVTRSSSAVCRVNTYPRLANASSEIADEQLVILIVGVGHRREACRARS